mmetsp:Transcript_6026/g.6160  ORF Transcript_6026/g.6160 Transcript_6026/m.6160 type:complete len:586 (-) Transcript_6026:134-1891(-)|eukprot:CAMPEP_0119049800 /NCGR_PEP_ID=MMETSP1177-20130426/66463_1 /TAXON_ID=2985 /ORGANISM="Ochromonas sp, Strain CCMP1899" /LENGTH=585 /DNA_ID=CAMNT_0007027465 /DNA_START=130 /DNA_END=1887 /DNA_ORIENTATION=-
MEDKGICSNPPCEESAKSKCSACSTVAYCGIDCQKAHWALHKKQCKAARAAASAANSGNSDEPVIEKKSNGSSDVANTASKLHRSKLETQVAFNKGDFISSVKSGNDALAYAKQLPEPEGSVEAIQIHLNMATAYLQLKKIMEAKIHSNLCVELAERGIAMRQGNPQAVEMLVVALGCKAYVLLVDDKADEAEPHASRALMFAEQIFPSDDVRLFKSIRQLATIKSAQDKLVDAQKHFKRAFDIVFQGHGPAHQETSQVTDEWVNVLMRLDKFDEAEKLVRKCHEAALKSGLDPENAWMGDAVGRIANVLAKANKEVEAESYMKQSLHIREKCFGPSHPLVGVTLGFLAGIQEGQGKFGEETEALLQRAMEIFRKTEGPQGAHVRASLMHVQRIRMKRDGRYTEGDDEIEEVSSRGVISSRTTAEQKAQIKAALHQEFEPDDGVSRMRHAAHCFEVQEYSMAEVLLAEAYEIFLRSHGPGHPSTAAALQNLEVVRTNALTQLWQEVAREEIEKMTVTDGPTASPVDPITPEREKVNSSVKSPKSPPGPGSAEVEEVTWCKPEKLSAEDEWLFRDQTKAGLGCSIC